jgi:SAM-dependent methyltransferase
MTHDQIHFTNGAAYDRYMALWSQRAGRAFLEWLEPPSGLRWLDVGCGSGAFTRMLIDRCAPRAIHGIDPSDAQLAYARSTLASCGAEFHQGDAMALPFPDNAFDAAAMALVIFFVPEPARGVAEMARVVTPGGSVAAYGWDLDGGGFPYEALLRALRERGLYVPQPPNPSASRLDSLVELWTDAGLESVETHAITVQRTFTGFEDYWDTVLGSASVGRLLASLTPDELADLRSTLSARLPTDAAGQITCGARAHAVKGRVPARKVKDAFIPTR